MTTIYSLKDLASATGVKAPVVKAPRPRKCKSCGAEMLHIEGSNVFVCQNMVTKKKKKDGEVIEIQEECGNTVIAKVE